jgi:predicted Ser/Thr protein kinase/tetratricopeptide (TPR) repeat protein
MAETETSETRGPREPGSSLVLERGDAVGRYVVISRIGKGGAGVVYRAYDPELDRAVAIKVVRSESGRRERLQREAQALARLQHPNVIAVHDVGTIAGEVFVAMEYVEGVTLKRWLRGGSTGGLRQVLDIFMAAGRGLQAAHDVGLVHRDFKPDNVLVGRDGRVRVLDFGLARPANLIDDAGPAPDLDLEIDTDRFLRTSLTQTGALLGTPRYMAPEQHLRRPADARTDQFSFCVALYEALYRQRPFEGETLSRLAASVTTGQIREAPPGSKVPARLRRILLRGLSVDPAQRFPSMAALLDALHAAAVAPRRRLAIAAIAVGVAVPIGVIAAIWHESDEPAGAVACDATDRYLDGVWDDPVRDRVAAAFERSRKPYARDTYQRVATHLDAYAARWTEARTELCEASRRGDQEAQVSEVRIACMNRRLRSLAATAELLGGADDHLIDQAVDAALRLPPIDGCDDDRLLAEGALLPRDPALRQRIADLGRELEEARALEAAAQYARALDVATDVAYAADELPYLPLQAEAHHEVGRIHDRLEELDQARPHHEQAARLAARVGDDGLAASALLAVQKDIFYQERLAGRSGEAALDLDVHVEAPFERVGRHDARYADYLMVAGDMRYRLERHDEARDYFERALQLREGLFGSDDVRVAESLVMLASSYPSDRKDDANRALARALAIYEAQLGAEHPAVAETLNRIGHYTDDVEVMIAAYDRAERIFAGAFGAENWAVGRSLNNGGEALCRGGDTARGLERLERGLAIYAREFGADHCHLAWPLAGIALCQMTAGEPASAITTLERALGICAGKGLHTSLVTNMQVQLAQAKWAAGDDREGALAIAREARAAYLEKEAHHRKELRELDDWLAVHGTDEDRRVAGRQ